MRMELQYQYKPFVEPGSIRLLRILPGNDDKAPIQCQLFEYKLDELTGREHIFEALSYCWGSSQKTHSITLDSFVLGITSNLHTALLHLRNHFLDRILWIDAICINQMDEQEKEHQIGLMYSIYSCANRVVVWLGDEADHSNQAIKALRVAGRQKAASSAYDERSKDAILRLLKRDWFRRIWVLQEVAAARHIQILCGRSALDGYTFCLAIDSMSQSFLALHKVPAVWSAIQSITQLIRDAIFRPTHRDSIGTTERIRPFHELVDMFHSHNATENRDKVYALLGMCSDDMTSSRLLPDYSVPFNELFKRVVQYILSQIVSIETQGTNEVAVIRSKIYVLGTIHSVEESLTASYEQRVSVSWKDISGLSDFPEACVLPWTLHHSATPLQKGDLVCLLPNAKNPSVVRLYQDFSVVLIIAPTMPPVVPSEGMQLEWPKARNRIHLPARDLVLVWDWHYSLDKYSELETFARWARMTEWVTQGSGTVAAACSEAVRTFNSACILWDLKAFEQAIERFCEGMIGFEKAIASIRGHRLPPNNLPVSSHGGHKQINKTPSLSNWDNSKGRKSTLEQLVSEIFAWSVQSGHIIGAGLLLDTTHVDASFRDSNGITLLAHAARSGNVDIVERLLRKKARVNDEAGRKFGRTAFQAAAEKGHLNIVRRLLRENADVNAPPGWENGRTALQAAAGSGHLPVVEHLLRHNADVNAAAGMWSGRTALQAAAEGGHLAIVERLLRQWADVNAEASGDNGRTALQAAAGSGRPDIVERLLQEGADVNAGACHNNGRTALQAAAESGHLMVVERLLQEDADVNAPRAEMCGKTALEAAAEGGHLNVVKRLRKELGWWTYSKWK